MIFTCGFKKKEKEMKKILIATCTLSILSTIPAFAADTITGTFLEAQQKRLDAQTGKIVNTERQLRQQQQNAINIKQQQTNEREKQLEAQQRAQQELINKKKQQIQNQKDMFNQQKNELKNLFTVQ